MYEVSRREPVFEEPVLKPMVEHYKAQLENLDMEYIRGNVNQLIEQKYHEVINKLKDYIQHDHIEKLDDEHKNLEAQKTRLTDLREMAEKQLRNI